jgi:hypothetical protein
MRKQGIDFHTHPVLIREMVERHPSLAEAARELYFIGNNFQPLETFHLELDLAGIEKAVVLPMDRATSAGKAVWTNEQIAELCRMSERFIGFATVDPHQDGASDQLKSAVKVLGLRGLKLNPPIQQFFPDDEIAYPLYETAQDLGLPILFHAGMSWEPGSRLQYGHPLRFENPAAAFPKLRIVLAHLAWPWIVEAVALALKYPNVYLDTSALYFDNPQDFLKFAMTHQVPLTVFERSLRKQLVFGSNYPRVEIKKMALAVDGLGFSEECLNHIFRTNAETLLEVVR